MFLFKIIFNIHREDNLNIVKLKLKKQSFITDEVWNFEHPFERFLRRGDKIWFEKNEQRKHLHADSGVCFQFMDTSGFVDCAVSPLRSLQIALRHHLDLYRSRCVTT
jgi:hypothetical protein